MLLFLLASNHKFEQLDLNDRVECGDESNKNCIIDYSPVWN